MTLAARRSSALALLVLALGACGGGEGFAEQARTRCAETRQAAKKLGGAVNPARLAQVLEQRNKLIRTMLTDLSELDPPDEQQIEYERMLGHYEQALGLQERVPHLLVDGDLAQAQSLLGRAADLAEKGDAIAKRLGLGACAQSEA